jgi:hypothetical protein
MLGVVLAVVLGVLLAVELVFVFAVLMVSVVELVLAVVLIRVDEEVSFKSFKMISPFSSIRLPFKPV